MEYVIITLFYIIPLIICIGIGVYIIKDVKGVYPAGGSAEAMLMFFLSFLPVINLIASLFILGVQVIEIGRNKTHGKN